VISAAPTGVIKNNEEIKNNPFIFLFGYYNLFRDK